MDAPGSREAILKGCTCSVLDNGHGKGCGYLDEFGNPMYWIDEMCPLHWPAVLNRKMKRIEKRRGK